jgi:3-hydroxyisobutyrate dehydrogenase-like beta-hydroxyacid dehydrogenase
VARGLALRSTRRGVEVIMKLSIIGLGKLGSPMAAVMAHKGHTAVGLDLVQRLLKLFIRAIAFDPAAMDDARSRAAEGAVAFAASAKDCARQADVLSIMTRGANFTSCGLPI